MKKLIAALIFAAAFATLFTGCSCADGTVSDNDAGETSVTKAASERMIDDTINGFNRDTTSTSNNSVVGNTDSNNRM